MPLKRYHPTISIAVLSLFGLFGSTQLAWSQTAPAAEVNEPAEPITNSAMDAEIFYKLLLAELNALDNEPRIAFALLLDTARKTKETALFERAITIALRERSGESALSAARAWLVADSTSLDAARYLVQISVGMNRLDQPTGKADVSIAVEVAKNALKSKPSDAEAVQLAIALMAAKSDTAEQLVKQYLANTTFQPKPEVRLAYSRALVTNSRFDEAKAQVLKLSVEAPTFASGWLVLGTLQYQESQEIVEKQGVTASSKASNEAAEMSLKKYIQLTDNLPPPQRAASQQRAYVLLANMAKTNKQYQQAYNILSKLIAASKTNKNDNDDTEVNLTDLQYDLAMMAEKLAKLDDMERILRQIIVAKPADPQAYNALGYSLAERNLRLPEAKTLIQQAVKLAPEDPFIADSLGWVEFKLGNLAEAQRVLENAYKTKPDAEIAAHLGEVLWKQGLKDRAMAVWKEGVSINKSNDTLVETLKRFGVKFNTQP
jgi:tetratricopeptide (TPR) repeat protein